MTHEQAQAFLLDLAYGELADEERRDVERHAASCASCAAELARIARVRSVAARLDEGPPPSDRRDALVEAARRAVTRRPERRWFARPAVLSFGAAAAVITLVVGVTLKLGGPGVSTHDEGRAESAPEPQAAPRSGGDGAPRPPESPPATEAEAARPEAAAPAPPAARTERRTAAAAPRAPARAPVTAEGDGEPSRAAAPAPASPPRAMSPAPGGTYGAPMEAPHASGPAPGASARQKSAARREVPAVADRAANDRGEASPRPAAEPEGQGRGDLHEERRQLRCGDTLVERVALVTPDGRVVKLSERRGAAVVEGRYDDAGRLRPARPAPGARAEAAAQTPLPPVAPTVEELEMVCDW